MKKTDLTPEQIAKKEAANEKRKQTCLERYGVDNPIKNSGVREKMTQTMLTKYGGHYMLSEDIKEKIKMTNLERYGVESPLSLQSCREGRRNEMIERYGTEYPMQVESIREKAKATCLRKYGVKFSTQSEEVKAKMKESKKLAKLNRESDLYKLPTGFVIRVSGYERNFLDNYYSCYDGVDEILWDTGEFSVNYEFEGKNKWFFPDFCLTGNRLIEVKSKWTFEKEIEKNIAKKKACEEMGYSLTFKVYDNGVEVGSDYVNGKLIGGVK